jgi:hypothetical protein
LLVESENWTRQEAGFHERWKLSLQASRAGIANPKNERTLEANKPAPQVVKNP